MSAAKVPPFNFAGGVTIKPIRYFGWLCFLRLGKVRSASSHSSLCFSISPQFAPRFILTLIGVLTSLQTEMVLFHQTFLSLKSRSPLTITINPSDYRLSGEKRVFWGKIVDDEFHHSLTVWQDEKCGGLRLVASVWSGELAKCPVWVAFGTSFFCLPALNFSLTLFHSLYLLPPTPCSSPLSLIF